MIHFNNLNDKNLVEIDAEYILKYVSQEEIYKLELGYEPYDGLYITSPFRVDNDPGCFFSKNQNGVLFFLDFNSNIKTHMTCFDFILHSNVDLQCKEEVYQFIKSQCIDGKNRKKRNINIDFGQYKKKRSEIIIKPRNFQIRDQKFWSQYGITKNQLINDLVYPLESYSIIKNNKKFTFECTSVSYAYTEFEEGRKEIYNPYLKDYKFVTNLKNDDIGGINDLVYNKDICITKSYKDYRILKNHIEKNVLWLKNENSLPSKRKVKEILEFSNTITIIYDNDRQGKIGGKKLRDYILSINPNVKVEIVTIPKFKPSIDDVGSLYLYNKINFRKLINLIK